MPQVSDRATAVSIDNACRRYRRGGGVGPLTYTITSGSVVGLVGGNGAGKTTLLRLISGLQACDSGSISVWGVPVRPGVPPAKLGAMIEEPPFYDFATGHENLRLAAAGRTDWEARIPECLSLTGLAGAKDQRVSEYSQGMRQRLGIARALLGEPELLILDEPSNGLDPSGIRWLRGLIRERAAAGVTVIISSHMLGEIGRTVDAALLLRAGELVAEVGALDLAKGPSVIEELYFGVGL